MYDRPDPDRAEPTPYLPAWLDSRPEGGFAAPEYLPGPPEPEPEPEPPAYEIVPAEQPALPVPTRREARAARGRPGLGGGMRMVLALAALVCLGVFGYWGWTFFQGTADRVHEGDCIAALNGTDVKPLDCADAAARFQVKEIFKDTSDVTVCEMVLGASNPLVVDQDGRNDVWCAGPK